MTMRISAEPSNSACPLAAAYAFDNGFRLGIRFGHISNADIHRVNPGENDLMVTYGIPLGL